MHRKLLLVFAPIVLLAAYAAENVPALAKLNFPNAGFRISALDEPAHDVASMPIAMSLPPTQGFSPNVNVVVLPYAKTMADFIDLSKKQFEASGFNILDEKKPLPNEWVIEYAGDSQGKKMHYYARMVLSNGQVYMATSTSLEEQWAAYNEKLKNCVASLEIPAKPAASAK